MHLSKPYSVDKVFLGRILTLFEDVLSSSFIGRLSRASMSVYVLL